MKQFKPADDYNQLLTQARALYRIVKSQEVRIEHLSKAKYDHSAERVEDLKAQIESEREMNKILTKELEQAQ